MKRKFVESCLQIAIVLLAGSVGGQGHIVPDKENAWAISALANLQDVGILVGHRPFAIEQDPHQARTERILASATYSAYIKLSSLFTYLDERITALRSTDPSESTRTEIEALEAQLVAGRKYHKNIRDLIKLSHYFSAELCSQGVDDVEMRTDLGDLLNRHFN